MELVKAESRAAEARAEVYAAITRQARSVDEGTNPYAARALEHLSRALAVLSGSDVAPPDADIGAGLQMTGPGRPRAGGHRVGAALELER